MANTNPIILPIQRLVFSTTKLLPERLKSDVNDIAFYHCMTLLDIQRNVVLSAAASSAHTAMRESFNQQAYAWMESVREHSFERSTLDGIILGGYMRCIGRPMAWSSRGARAYSGAYEAHRDELFNAVATLPPSVQSEFSEKILQPLQAQREQIRQDLARTFNVIWEQAHEEPDQQSNNY
jgi:hypothetical protein